MKTYNHKNEELISEETIAIIKKNAKNKRIELEEKKKKELRGKLFLLNTMVIFATALYFLATLAR